MILCKTITHELKLQMRYWRKVYNVLSPRRTCSSHIENWTKICEIPFLMYEWWSWIIISYIGMLCCGILSSTNSNHTEQQQCIFMEDTRILKNRRVLTWTNRESNAIVWHRNISVLPEIQLQYVQREKISDSEKIPNSRTDTHGPSQAKCRFRTVLWIWRNKYRESSVNYDPRSKEFVAEVCWQLTGKWLKSGLMLHFKGMENSRSSKYTTR